MDFLLSLLVAGVVMGMIDALWLGVIANKLYKDELGGLLRKKPDMVAAVLFYIVYVVGIVLFAVQPANSWQDSLWLGALLGFVAYATYDLTNRATVKGFPWKIVVIDLVWGTLLTATVATVTYTAVSAWL
ncbi:TPA: DUF2177 domain-containing protein [Candidatus Saccharibacteria bacterium]|nr:DUF2177 domain-containing protein [Candidatus Saccharibacteria bacterium]HRK41280.1 DUF2177 family protein [Candidatus Saccharibacteria bacterium]